MQRSSEPTGPTMPAPARLDPTGTGTGTGTSSGSGSDPGPAGTGATGAVVTTAEIARLAGVGRAAVSNWRRRYDDFPAPVAGTPNSPAFMLAQVEAWLRLQGKLRRVTVEDRLWHQLDAARGDLPLADAVGLVGAFVLLCARDPDLARRPFTPPETAPADLPTTPADLPAELPAAIVRLAATLPGPELPPLPRSLVPVLATIARMVAGTGAVETFGYLLDRYAAMASRRVSLTPTDVADLMVALAGSTAPAGRPAVVLDPACGHGTLLDATVRAASAGGEAPEVRVLGQEADPAAARLAAIRLSLQTEWCEIRHGASLREDAFPDVRADAVVCAPPFASRGWGAEDLAYDERWEYGVPPRGEPELAWVQHALARVRTGGMVVIAMPPAAAGRASGRRIRSELLRRAALRAVIALPAGSLTPTAGSAQLWVLRRPEAAATAGDVLLVDADAIGPGSPAPASVSGADWDAVKASVVSAWSTYDGRHAAGRVAGRLPDDAVVAGVVPVVELLDDDVDLTPSRRLIPPPGRDIGPRFAELIGTLRDMLGKGPGLLPDLTAGSARDLPAEDVPGSDTVRELVRLGALTVSTTPIRGGVRSSEKDPGLLREGDVLVPLAAPTVVSSVVTEAGTGVLAGSRAFVIRVDREIFDPWYVAGVLRTPENRRRTAGAGSTDRIDVRRARIPRLSLDRQRPYAEAFRDLLTLEHLLARGAELSRELTETAAESLAYGLLRPGISQTHH